MHYTRHIIGNMATNKEIPGTQFGGPKHSLVWAALASSLAQAMTQLAAKHPKAA